MAWKCKDCPVATTGLKIAAAAPDSKEVTKLPPSDFLVMSWTEAETHAVGQLLGDHNYHFITAASTNFTPLKLAGVELPARATCHGYFFQTSVNGKSVVCIKSETHPKSQPALMDTIMRKLMAEHPYKQFITTGTGGGIWDSIDVGDVVVTNHARYGLTLSADKQKLHFTGETNVEGRKADDGLANWFDYVNKHLITSTDCVATTVFVPGGRDKNSGTPKIIYKADGAKINCVVTNQHFMETGKSGGHIDEEQQNLAQYKTMGSSLDENDAYVVETLHAINFKNWVSIRNISDVPRMGDNGQYENYQYCSSIHGAMAVWAFVMGH